MKIVVDTNIVFSAILNTKGKIGQLLINGSNHFDFYTVGLLKTEITNHKTKILKLTGFSHKRFDSAFQIIVNRINFIDDILLSNSDLQKAIELVCDVDIDDIMFIALNNHLSAHLWTGDKQLIKGLKNKGYSRFLNTNEIYDIYLHKQLKQ
ncbi:MAG: hypothetical protein DRJ05_15050 [Bacteroidetes bacterium]|nr:MAG: hypothetical protein DRJ05_15050 [Bacteroidota bacterium]